MSKEVKKRMILKSFEYRIYPNKRQEELIAKHIGCSRWIYNYALDKKIKSWTIDKKNLSRFDIQKELPILKNKKETEWLKEVNSQSLQASLEHLDNAYKRFFKMKKGFPKFKSKHKSKQSFSIPQHSKVDFKNNLLLVPKIEPLKIVLHRKFKGIIKTITIKKTNTNKYFAVVLVETKDNIKKTKKIKESTTIGIDLGIKNFAVLSNGEKINNPKVLMQYENKLAKAQRKVSRKTKGSSNRNKAKLIVSRIHEKIANIRKDFLNKLTHKLTHENQVRTIVMEDLSVSNMMKNHCLAKSIGDCSWSEFIRQLTYKAHWYGINLLTIGKFEPSSKLCSNCGTVNQELTLKDREWTCKNCGIKHDRDVNASINIKAIGLKQIPMERRELTLGENRGSNLVHLNQEAPAFRQG
jgi:putative transposase